MEDRMFRDAMGKFATGVNVLTTEVDGESYGMTANAFMSVSLSPKLIVISIGERAKFLERVKESGRFAVNVLADEQQHYSMMFAGQLNDGEKCVFDYLDGLPVVPGSIAQISCNVVNDHIEGDHTLFIGEVTDIRLEEKEPLIFYRGKYRALEAMSLV
ncbi:flavin reductase [Bhargavaea cecembensis]|uniref:Flavin reductase n=1 Tax=Bhargavaea cecembensis TaxID=394098 RepID=A0A163FID7_9BACL|nr:flavin reductase family protein [Bhargavaea cecembensis]KZE38757.1 flavin reductase [Bhargavaea cecembensis]